MLSTIFWARNCRLVARSSLGPERCDPLFVFVADLPLALGRSVGFRRCGDISEGQCEGGGDDCGRKRRPHQKTRAADGEMPDMLAPGNDHRVRLFAPAKCACQLARLHRLYRFWGGPRGAFVEGD
ncbi:hypothetical protein [Jiella pelagia]|uniref:Uncharacterized protein n=1 Tax=Jiella pelagia TaxID=2986949 RepID=A0ABY7C0B6_9HYPH|nr:hypothetical protein [Jiella pelagia]WAP68790.1 hypothetical protein OH818_26705 [Jiella pelagia]